MTVEELIESLSKIEDKSIRVMVRVCEGGYNDATIDSTPVIVDIALDVNDEWYYGKHERVEDVIMNARGEYSIVKAIIL